MADLSRKREASGKRTKTADKMRVLFIAHRTPYPPNKGDKLRSFWELTELSKRHEVDLFAFYDDPEDVKYIERLKSLCRNVYLEPLSLIQSRLHALVAVAAGRPFSTGYFYSRTMARRISSALRARSYDRIVIFSSSMAQYVESAVAPKIVDLVDVDSDKWEQYAKRYRGLRRWLWQREARHLGAYEAQLTRESSVTLVCTEAEALLLRSIAPEGDIRVLQNFLDVEKYDPGKVTLNERVRSWQPYVVFSGSMDYLPNIDAAQYFVHEILPLIRREVPKTRFVIAGRNPDRSILKMASHPDVEVTGSVADIKPYICGAAVAVVPMRIARGVQNKILEALAAGVPVVSTDAAAKALPGELRSMLSVADTPSEFAAAVVRILRQGGPLRGQQIRAVLEEYIQNQNLPLQFELLLRGKSSTTSAEEQLSHVG